MNTKNNQLSSYELDYDLTAFYKLYLETVRKLYSSMDYAGIEKATQFYEEVSELALKHNFKVNIIIVTQLRGKKFFEFLDVYYPLE